MFVRATWRDDRFISVNQGLRANDVPTSRDPRLPGTRRSDMVAMTRGLFDR